MPARLVGKDRAMRQECCVYFAAIGCLIGSIAKLSDLLVIMARTAGSARALSAEPSK